MSNGQYEVHYMRVTFPHHIIANQDFTVVGADWPRWPTHKRVLFY